MLQQLYKVENLIFTEITWKQKISLYKDEKKDKAGQQVKVVPFFYCTFWITNNYILTKKKQDNYFQPKSNINDSK